MKKTYYFLFAVLLFCLAGCTSNVLTPTETPTAPQIFTPTEMSTEAPTEQSTQPTEETTNPTVETTPTEAVVSSPTVITLNPIQEDETAEDGTVVYSFRYQDIDLLLPQGAEVQAKIQDSMDALIAYSKDQTKTAAAAWARECYTGAGDWSAYYTDIIYTPRRMDHAVISVSAQTLDFNGGSHPNCSVISMNFKGETGEVLRISDIITQENHLQELHSMVLEYLEGENGPKQLLDGYEEVVMDRFDAASATSGNWYLAEQGLVYFFAPYEVAPYRYGVVEAVLPYEMLQGILEEAYLPEDTTEKDCSIIADISANVSTEFERTHTIVLEAEGECITLYGLENAGSVNISVGYWGIDDNLFYPTETLFSAKGLTGEDCIKIMTYIPDTIPNVRIQIGGEDGKTLYLSQSGEDGSILLLEEGNF